MMTINPMTEIAANACGDCPAEVAVVPSRSGVTGQPALVVTVTHATTCPWAARFVGAPLAIVARAEGIVIHFRPGTEDLDAPPSPGTATSTTDTPDDGPATPDET